MVFLVFQKAKQMHLQLTINLHRINHNQVNYLSTIHPKDWETCIACGYVGVTPHDVIAGTMWEDEIFIQESEDGKVTMERVRKHFPSCDAQMVAPLLNSIPKV